MKEIKVYEFIRNNDGKIAFIYASWVQAMMDQMGIVSHRYFFRRYFGKLVKTHKVMGEDPPPFRNPMKNVLKDFT